jgi:hypothetical protein
MSGVWGSWSVSLLLSLLTYLQTLELFFLERLFSPPYEIGALLSQIIQQFGSMPTKMHEKYVSKLGAKEGDILLPIIEFR